MYFLRIEELEKYRIEMVLGAMKSDNVKPSSFIPVAKILDKKEILKGFRVYSVDTHELMDLTLGDIIQNSLNGKNTAGISVGVNYTCKTSYDELESIFKGLELKYNQSFYRMLTMPTVDEETHEILYSEDRPTLIGVQYTDEDEMDGHINFISVTPDGKIHLTPRKEDLLFRLMNGVDISRSWIAIDGLREYTGKIDVVDSPVTFSNSSDSEEEVFRPID